MDKFMLIALELAQKAYEMGEVPVGAVVVRNNEIIGRGYNRREVDKNALCHAEMMAIDEACKKLGGWRLHQCDLYVTLEPCPMCAGAIINARIASVYYGASDPKAGCIGSKINLFELGFNHKPIVHCGIMADNCSKILKDFFSKLRTLR